MAARMSYCGLEQAGQQVTKCALGTGTELKKDNYVCVCVRERQSSPCSKYYYNRNIVCCSETLRTKQRMVQKREANYLLRISKYQQFKQCHFMACRDEGEVGAMASLPPEPNRKMHCITQDLPFYKEPPESTLPTGMF